MNNAIVKIVLGDNNDSQYSKPALITISYDDYVVIKDRMETYDETTYDVAWSNLINAIEHQVDNLPPDWYVDKRPVLIEAY